MDAVLSTFVRPALMVIDTYWSPDRLSYDDDAFISQVGSPSTCPGGAIVIQIQSVLPQALTSRLDKARAAGLPVISAAGIGLPPAGEAAAGGAAGGSGGHALTSPWRAPHPADLCTNIFASHPAMISVAATDPHDHRTPLAPGNSSCIHIWAPGGGLAAGITGAHPSGPGDYRTIMPRRAPRPCCACCASWRAPGSTPAPALACTCTRRAFGASWIAAGVAAQVLEQRPDASVDELRAALLALSTPDVVLGGGAASPNRLLYTNLTDPPPEATDAAAPAPAPAPAPEGGSSSTVAVAVAVPVALVAAAGGLLLGAALLRRRRRRRQQRAAALDKERALVVGTSGAPANEWEIREEQIQICKRPDGSDWLLGVSGGGRDTSESGLGASCTSAHTLLPARAAPHTLCRPATLGRCGARSRTASRCGGRAPKLPPLPLPRLQLPRWRWWRRWWP